MIQKTPFSLNWILNLDKFWKERGYRGGPLLIESSGSIQASLGLFLFPCHFDFFVFYFSQKLGTRDNCRDNLVLYSVHADPTIFACCKIVLL